MLHHILRRTTSKTVGRLESCENVNCGQRQGRTWEGKKRSQDLWVAQDWLTVTSGAYFWLMKTGK